MKDVAETLTALPGRTITAEQAPIDASAGRAAPLAPSEDERTTREWRLRGGLRVS